MTEVGCALPLGLRIGCSPSGGSTNGVLHLQAVAAELDLDIPLVRRLRMLNWQVRICVGGFIVVLLCVESGVDVDHLNA